MLHVYAGIRVQKCVAGVCSTLIAKEEELNELDRGSGDGDCGSTLKAGMTGEMETSKDVYTLTFCHYMYIHATTAIQEKLSCIHWDQPQQVLLTLASIVGDSMGGSSGAVS